MTNVHIQSSNQSRIQKKDSWTPGFGNAYWNLWDLATVLKRKWTGPTKVNEAEFASQPNELKCSDVPDEFTVVGIGDILPHNDFQITIDTELKQWISATDYILANFEGLISSDRRIINAVRHATTIVPWLNELTAGKKTCLTVANNHSGDCGLKGFEQTVSLLRQNGYLIAGTIESPHVILDDRLTVSAATQWFNTPSPFVIDLRKIQPPESNNKTFAIAMPHWGFEMTMLPSRAQARFAKNLVKSWDMILGGHPHCPQPVRMVDNKLVAYSLGNFCWGFDPGWPLYGQIIRFSVGRNHLGEWQVGKLSWRFVRQHLERENKSIHVGITENCSFVQDFFPSTGD